MKQGMRQTVLIAALLALGLAGCQQKEETPVPETMAPAVTPPEPTPPSEAPAPETSPPVEDKPSTELAPGSATPAK